MKKVLALLFCFTSYYAQSQIYYNPFLNVSVSGAQPRAEVQLNSTYNLASNALNSKFYKDVFFSDSISGEAKNSVLKNLKAQNTMGLYLHNDIFYAWKAKNKERQYYIDISSRTQFTSRFTADAYKLLMYGNKQFAGQTAMLSMSGFNENAYQSIQFGFYQSVKKTQYTNLVLGGGISLVLGAGYTQIDVQRGSLFTSQDGDSLALDAKFNYKSVGSTNLITNVNGIGASFNLFGAYQFKNKDVLRFQVADLGFVNWYHNTSSLQADQKISYTGLKISSDSGVFRVNSPSRFYDSVTGKFTNGKTTNSFVQGLPFQVRLAYVKFIDSTLSITASAEYIYDNMPVPELSLSVKKVFGRLSGRLGVSGFGYGTYGIILGAEYHFSKNISVLLGTQHIEGLVLQESNGQGYFASLKWRSW
jgi:hypothetical protein